jgi:ATP-binding cassette subfamily B protein
MNQPAPKITGFFRNYLRFLIPLIIAATLANGLGLVIPALISKHIDIYQVSGSYNFNLILLELIGITVAVALFTLIQSALATFTAEKMAYDLRDQLAKKISQQSFHYVSTTTVAKLLTIITSDVDGIKGLISQGIVAIFSALLILIGSSIALLSIDLKLALITLSIIPLIAFAFSFIFGRIGKLFRAAQENLEKINKVVNESIIGASLVRVLNAENQEKEKFDIVNTKSHDIGFAIVKGFGSLFPIINLLANASTLLILWFGGLKTISGELSLGNFAAFFAYASMLLAPVFIIAFISTTMSRAFISWQRINSVLQAPLEEVNGTITTPIKGDISFESVSLAYNEKTVLKNISFAIKQGSRTAIVGPVSAGKSQILYLIARLIQPTQGAINIDDKPLADYERDTLMHAIGLVFQDSIILNTTVRENIQLHESVDESALQKAIDTAQLRDLIASLPQGLETQISERGSNLSGGQKQRLMLARALALNPKVLLLDDFTARVDQATEKEIINAIQKNYPNLTLISITQKIEPIKTYDQIIVLMEGELIAIGTHEDLLASSLEYQQICESQKTSE